MEISEDLVKARNVQAWQNGSQHYRPHTKENICGGLTKQSARKRGRIVSQKTCEMIAAKTTG